MQQRAVTYLRHYSKIRCRDNWFPVTTARRVLRMRMEERPPIWRVAANILNKQLRTADKGWSTVKPRRSACSIYRQHWKICCYTVKTYTLWMTVWYAYQSSIKNNKYQVSHKYRCFSWWWAHSRPKHVEKRNKHTRKNGAPSWLYLQR